MHWDVVAHDGQARDSFVMALRIEEDGLVLIQNVELAGPNARLNFQFDSGNTLESVVTPEACGSIFSVVSNLLRKRVPLSLPDFRVKMRNLIISGCRAMVTSLPGDADEVVIHFEQYVGNILSLFHTTVVSLNTLAKDASDLAVTALETTLLPMLNFGSFLTADLVSNKEIYPSPLRQKLELLADRIASLEASYLYLAQQATAAPGAIYRANCSHPNELPS